MRRGALICGLLTATLLTPAAPAFAGSEQAMAFGVVVSGTSDACTAAMHVVSTSKSVDRIDLKRTDPDQQEQQASIAAPVRGQTYQAFQDPVAAGTYVFEARALVVNAKRGTTRLIDADTQTVDVSCPDLATAAVGSIATPAASALADGEAFVLGDGLNPPTTFEFDTNGSTDAASVDVVLAPGDDGATVKTKIINAVNGVGSGLGVSASNGGGSTAALVNDAVGAFGNVPITESVTSEDFVVAGMSGGSDSGIGNPTNTAAVGSIATPAASELADGEAFVLGDGSNPPTTFEFDTNGSTDAASVAVVLAPGDTGATVKTKIINAVNGVGSGLGVSASNGGGFTAALVNDAVGAFGNVPITESVTSGDFVVAGMSGGSDPS